MRTLTARDGNDRTRMIGGLAIVAIIGIACLAMASFLRHGLPAGSVLAERMAFVAAHPIAWPLAWLPWMASALGLLLFCIWLREYAPPSPARVIGVALVGIGVVPDIAAESLYAFVLPTLAAPALAVRYYDIELIATLLTGVLANGAYCLGGLILNLALFRNPRFPRLIAWAGLPAWLLGLGLSVAVLTGRMQAAMILTALSMSLSLAWMFVVAIYVFRFPRRYRWSRA